MMVSELSHCTSERRHVGIEAGELEDAMAAVIIASDWLRFPSVGVLSLEAVQRWLVGLSKATLEGVTCPKSGD